MFTRIKRWLHNRTKQKLIDELNARIAVVESELVTNEVKVVRLLFRSLMGFHESYFPGLGSCTLSVDKGRFVITTTSGKFETFKPKKGIRTNNTIRSYRNYRQRDIRGKRALKELIATRETLVASLI